MTMSAEKGLREASGLGYDEWFARLDEWGAPGRPFREIADWLEGSQGLSKWWAQKLIVEYEEARGLRSRGARSDGTFTVTASKTISAPADTVLDAFADEDVRGHWLPGVRLDERTSQPGRSARFDWADDESRLNVSVTTSSAGKCQVAVEHAQLPDDETAARMKDFWRSRLGALKALLDDEGK